MIVSWRRKAEELSMSELSFKQYSDIHAFYNDVYDVLMLHEAQNLIPLGNIIIGNEGKDKTEWRDPTKWLMAVVSCATGIRLTALMTPPHNITLYATNNIIDPEAIACLVQGLGDWQVPGVTSEKSLAECFAREYTRYKGLSFETTMKQRIYELTAVTPLCRISPTVPLSACGVVCDNTAPPAFWECRPEASTDSQQNKDMVTVRLLSEGDMHFFPYWVEAFYAAAEGADKTQMSIPQSAERYRYLLSEDKAYVLEYNGMPVCMASHSRAMQTAIGISYVYTPPYERKKGYATALVAHISQLALDKGYTKCVLYTDLENAVSNSIYQKIGYVCVCDSLQVRFVGVNEQW
ncbi:MAG: GNAT family N-acetyltransferase [Defluviitaleaceae bacterium]|nr:GNAT family N-acetyltransferase [Defluviitaleaceae bacterium]